jgi:hypothetical protein
MTITMKRKFFKLYCFIFGVKKITFGKNQLIVLIFTENEDPSIKTFDLSVKK